MTHASNVRQTAFITLIVPLTLNSDLMAQCFSGLGSLVNSWRHFLTTRGCASCEPSRPATVADVESARASTDSRRELEGWIDEVAEGVAAGARDDGPRSRPRMASPRRSRRGYWPSASGTG